LILSYKYFYPKNNPPSNLINILAYLGLRLISSMSRRWSRKKPRDDAVMGRKGRRKNSIELKRAALADCAIWRVTDVVI
jgi:hypothetical protein